MKKFNNYNEVLNEMINIKKGIGYFIMGYCTPDDMPDDVGKVLFSKAQKALFDYENYVNLMAEKETENKK